MTRKTTYFLRGQSELTLARTFFGVYMSPIRINAEAEAHATGGVGAVVAVVTRSVDNAEGGAVADIRRTQPPVVILLVGLGGAILLANR